MKNTISKESPKRFSYIVKDQVQHLTLTIDRLRQLQKRTEDKVAAKQIELAWKELMKLWPL